jgi:hypothetical protein
MGWLSAFRCSDRGRSWLRACIVIVFVLGGTASISNAFFLKWGFNDAGEDAYSLVRMAAGTADRPYVYRSLLPAGIYSATANLTPQQLGAFFERVKRHDNLHNQFFWKLPLSSWDARLALTYYVMYLLILLCIAALLCQIFFLSRSMGAKFGEALGLCSCFCLTYPLVFEKGGFFYDFLELNILMLLVSSYSRGRRSALLWAIVLACVKETAFIYSIILLLSYRQVGSSTLLKLLMVALPLSIRQWLVSYFAGNGGGVVELHVWENLRFWFDPGTWVAFGTILAPGVLSPRVQNPIFALPMLIWVRYGWAAAKPEERRFLVVSIAMVLPLYLVWGYKDEVRAASMVFPSLIILTIRGARQFWASLGREADQDMAHA